MFFLTRNLLRLEAFVAVCAYVLTAGLLLSEVIARELFTESIWGSQKIAVFAAIIAGSLGLAIATSENAHLRPSFADGLLPYGWVDRLGDVLSALLFAGFGYFAIVFVQESIEYKDVAEVIRIPLWPIQIVLPYAFFSSALRHLIFAVEPDLKPEADIASE